MWPAARYCIGRHTYVNSYADTFAKIVRDNREKFNNDRLQFWVRDIRSEITEAVRWKKNVTAENYGNDLIGRDAYTLIGQWLEHNPGKRFCDHDFEVDCMRCEVKAYEREEPLMSFGDYPEILYDSDLQHWVRLANFIDRSTHVRVTTECQGNREEEICIPFIDADQIVDAQDRPTGDYAYHTRYRALTDIACPWWISPECIVKVEPLTPSKQ